MSSPARVIRMVTLWSGRNPDPVTRCPLALIEGAAGERGAAKLPDTEMGMVRSYHEIGSERRDTVSDTNSTLPAILTDSKYGSVRLNDDGQGDDLSSPLSAAGLL